MSTIGWILFITGWLGIVWLQFWLVRKVTWLQYDVELVRRTRACEAPPYKPTNNDWMNNVNLMGGPFGAFPFLQVLVILVILAYWVYLKCELADINTLWSDKWENKELKR